MAYPFLVQYQPPLAMSWIPVMDPSSPDASAIYQLFMLVCLICLVIFVAVVSFICASLFRFRAAGGEIPAQDFGSHRMEVLWTVPPVLIVAGLAVLAVRLIVSMSSFPTHVISGASDADLVVVGHQWWWEVRYPQSHAVTANEIHIPVGRKLCVRVDSADVIHSFWIPELAPKIDMVPGHPNFVWLRADRAGTYEGACSEFCGDQHAWMRFIVVAENQNDYGAWLARQAQPASVAVGSLAVAGEKLFLTQTCASCHAVGGSGAVANAAPDLTHLRYRRLLAAGVIANTPANLEDWLRDPERVKPGCKMPNFNLSQDQIAQLTAYLEGTK